MMHCKRRLFTLLETLIAVSLAVVILSTMAFFYREVDFINNQVEQVQKESFMMRYVESRLANILPQTVAPSSKDKADDFYFFTSSDLGLDTLPGSATTLVFTFNNGFDIDKIFANRVIGRMYLDSKKRLCLAKWPSPKRWIEGVPPPMKHEVLVEDVESLIISFFVAPEKKWKFEGGGDETKDKDKKSPPKKKPAAAKGKASLAEPEPEQTAQSKSETKPTPEGTWIDHWQQEFRALPAMIKLQIKRRGQVETFVFPFPHSKQPIVYKE